MKQLCKIFCLLSMVAVSALQAVVPCTPPIFSVTTNADSGLGSLRQAIIDSNGSLAPFPHTICFSGFAGGVITITSADLPVIMVPTIINGYSAPGSNPNTANINQPNNAVITVQIDGPGAVLVPTSGPFWGLQFGPGSDGSIVQGVSITNFAGVMPTNMFGGFMSGGGILITANNVSVLGNFIGANPTALTTSDSQPNFTGIQIDGDNVIIGDGTPFGRNLISGQFGGGGVISNVGNNTIIKGNTIGLNATGNLALMPDARVGLVSGDETGSIIGGLGPNELNVIAGFSGANIFVAFATDTLVQGNYIGLDITGNFAVGPNGIGIFTANEIAENKPSGLVFDSNVISGNNYGIMLGENNFN